MAGGASKVSGVFTLTYQLDGNLVLYRSGAPIWSSGTVNTSVGNVAMQADGNLVVYDQGGVPRFNTGTQNNPGATLHIDGTGRLLILATDGRTLWTGAMP